jgi:hypothetical protein
LIDTGGLNIALHGVGLPGERDDAARGLARRTGAGDDVGKTRIDALEAGRLRVRDVARDVFEREGLRLQAADRSRHCTEDTHNSSSTSPAARMRAPQAIGNGHAKPDS